MLIARLRARSAPAPHENAPQAPRFRGDPAARARAPGAPTRRPAGRALRCSLAVGSRWSLLASAPRDAHAVTSGGTAICRLRTLPVGPLGRASTSQTCRGYLYAATWALTYSWISAGVLVPPGLRTTAAP